jgi:uncharacterized protein YxeA
MKTAIIIISIIVVLVIISQIYILMSTQKSETQPYKIIRKEEKFEIRHYPSATMAMITSNTKSYKELGSSGFRKLAGYIFGGNKDSKQISMISPVHMEINDSVSSMSFVMPSNYHKDNLPLPNDTEVIIKTSPKEYVAAIRFEGFTSEEDIQKHKIILERSLKENKLSYYGSFRYLGYNPPYQLLGRRNEMIVSLNWDGK